MKGIQHLKRRLLRNTTEYLIFKKNLINVRIWTEAERRRGLSQKPFLGCWYRYEKALIHYISFAFSFNRVSVDHEKSIYAKSIKLPIFNWNKCILFTIFWNVESDFSDTAFCFTQFFILNDFKIFLHQLTLSVARCEELQFDGSQMFCGVCFTTS